MWMCLTPHSVQCVNQRHLGVCDIYHTPWETNAGIGVCFSVRVVCVFLCDHCIIVCPTLLLHGVMCNCPPPPQSLSSMHGIPAQRNDKEIVIVLSALHTCTLVIHTRTHKHTQAQPQAFQSRGPFLFPAMKPNN